MRRYDNVPKPLNAYYAAITAIDDQIARLTRSLSDLGLAEDTIVLFSSDHGDMLGTHGAKLKRKPWEESIRVPGIFRYPAASSRAAVRKLSCPTSTTHPRC